MGASPSTTTQNQVHSATVKKSLSFSERRNAEKQARENELLDKMFFKQDNNGFNMFHRAATGFSIGIFEEAKQHHEERGINQNEEWDDKLQTPHGDTPLSIAIYNNREHNKDEFGPDRYNFIKF